MDKFCYGTQRSVPLLKRFDFGRIIYSGMLKNGRARLSMAFHPAGEIKRGVKKYP
jgi:hypothetical protein